MDYVYYPGCTLFTKARNLDACARKAAERVGFTLKEMPSWNCCGAIYNTSSDDLAAQVGPVRNLAKASQLGDRLVTLCAACYNVLRRTQDMLDGHGDAQVRDRLLSFVEEPFAQQVRVVHYLEVLKKDIGWENLKSRIARPLNGLKVASYYGCLMVRPADVLSFDNPENPQVMDELMRVLGAEPVRFDFKAECCGGYLVVNRRDVARECSTRIVENARAWGAEAIVTTCPLCQFNIERLPAPSESALPVFYFTQLLGLAVGMGRDELGLDWNTPAAGEFLQAKGLV
ncbi:MAG: CoB--CoM heterodisulfide reductase iron-sulfur subunit B family protein [candidate division WOR-3 bacterium]